MENSWLSLEPQLDLVPVIDMAISTAICLHFSSLSPMSLYLPRRHLDSVLLLLLRQLNPSL